MNMNMLSSSMLYQHTLMVFNSLEPGIYSIMELCLTLGYKRTCIQLKNKRRGLACNSCSLDICFLQVVEINVGPLLNQLELDPKYQNSVAAVLPYYYFKITSWCIRFHVARAIRCTLSDNPYNVYKNSWPIWAF